MTRPVEIRPLTALSAAELDRLIVGYTAEAYYAVTRAAAPGALDFQLRLVPRATPLEKRWPPLTAEVTAHYLTLADNGLSHGAYAGEELAGLALAEAQTWNASLWIQELHVAPAYQRQGLGRRLLAATGAAGRVRGLRRLVVEAQNTNVPALNFYQAVGFTLDGLDLTYYADGVADAEVALFLKRPL